MTSRGGILSAPILPAPIDSAPVNPILPAGPDFVWTALGVLLLGLVVAAIVTVWSARVQLELGVRALWTLAIVVVPILGSLAWFAFGLRSATAVKATAKPR